MVNSKINLFREDWINTVFAERNKEYGAYDLRRREARVTAWATVIGVVFFALLVTTPLLIRKMGSTATHSRSINEVVTLVDLMSAPPDVPQEAPPPPPPVREIKSLQEVKKFTPPVVTTDDQEVEEMVTQEELKTAQAGARNIEASDDGEIFIDETPVDYDVEKQIVEDDTIHSQRSVQVQPEYPGGLQEFVKYVISRLDGINVDQASGNIRMSFTFVIEKDGTLTDIRIVDDGGHPSIASRAVRVLGWSPKWQPGVNNGRPVRVSYSIPIIIQVQNI